MLNLPTPDIATFDHSDYDPGRGIYRFGNGELGGKAAGLATLSRRLEHRPFTSFQDRDGNAIRIIVPPSLVITTEMFELFVHQNRLDRSDFEEMSDGRITEHFERARLPETLETALGHYLRQNEGCLVVRSSSLLEDSRRFGYAGMYCSAMLANDDPDIDRRVSRLARAIQQVYASTFYSGPRSYARRLGHSTDEEKMAVIIQPLIGSWHNDLFLPAISGIAQSHNYYPLPPMRQEDGLAIIALGMGRTVVSGEKSLCFSPKHPRNLPQRSSAQEILANSQTHFYALHSPQGNASAASNESPLLVRKPLSAIADAPFMRYVASTWNPTEERIRDTVQQNGARVLTFAPILKHGLFPLTEIITSLLERGQGLMNCPVEIEFAVDFGRPPETPATFGVLQLRPMSTRQTAVGVAIEAHEIEDALCYSTMAMGNRDDATMTDIVYINPERFDPARTREMAEQVAKINAALTSEGRRYVLIGPGRWGSQDPWLGIPVRWQHIAGVGAIVETNAPDFRVEFSQGAHLFHNLTVAGICYLCVTGSAPDRLDWRRLRDQPIMDATDHVVHVRLPDPLRLKVDGRTACGLITVAQTE